VAIGGYGRGELNPYSDIDIMFLHEDGLKNVEKHLGQVVQQILYMLWDVGFKVGHSTRSITGAIKQANATCSRKTSLLEARLVAGDEELFEQFRKEFVEHASMGHEDHTSGPRQESGGAACQVWRQRLYAGAEYQKRLWQLA
jgi:[protein-PII] uridylyltransferase